MSLRRGKGCSFEMADKIVNLLLSQLTLAPLPPAKPQPTCVPAVECKVLHRRRRKLSTEVVLTVLALQGRHPTEVVEEVRQVHGISVSVSSVYKVWRSRYSV